ncbi:MAG: phosphoesterase [Candidatus Tyloplasma litorale]|nr:MAG: phosphoesterase [Mycoplasmatales bacterium]
MKILILSDIHGDLKTMNKIIQQNLDVDLKIFLGDFQVSIKQQKKLTNLFDYVVMGNSDYPNISPLKKILEIDGIRILLHHGHYYTSFKAYVDKKMAVKDAIKNNASIVIHGHNHIGEKSLIDNIIIFNPGSPSFPRGGTKPSYGFMEIENGELKKLENIYQF